MLKKLRNKKTAKKIWLILAFLIVPPFVLWGLGGALRSRQEDAYLGKISGRKVSPADYKEALEAVTNQAVMQLGDNFSELKKHLNLPLRAKERLLLLYEAKRRKIGASDKEVIELIESYPFFQRNGQFDNRIYSEILRYVFRTLPRAFEEQTRQNLMLSKLFKQATDGIKVSEEEVREEYRKANEEISVYYIAGLPADFAKNINPSEEQIRDYFSAHSLQFKEPLSFNLDYIAAPSAEKAEAVLAALDKKTEFAKAAKDSGLEAKETGLFPEGGPIPGIGWSAEILELAAKLETGQCSRAVEADKRFYILKVKEKKEASIPDFEKVKEKAKAMFIKDKSEWLAKTKTEECLKALKEPRQDNKPADFSETAKAFGLKSEASGPFKFGSYIEGIGASDNFWTAACGLKENEFSEIINTPSGFYIIKVKSKTPVDEKKFENEKAGFSEKLLSQKKGEYFFKFTEDLKKAAQF